MKILAEEKSNFRFLYELDLPSKIRLRKLPEIYGADGVDYSNLAERHWQVWRNWAMVTCLSVWPNPEFLSDNPALKGRPRDSG